MITITLTDAGAEALFSWLEEERDDFLAMANDSRLDGEDRKIFEARYRAIREVMDQLSTSATGTMTTVAVTKTP